MGFEIFDFRMFLGRKILAKFFEGGSLIKAGIILGIQTNVSFFAVISFNAFWKFLWPGYSAWDFLVLNFGLGIFWGF